MLRRGKKTQKWDRVRKELKVQFDTWQIRFCENCGTHWNLRFAHRLKRRFITTEAELRTVALLCARRDIDFEYGGHERLFQKITELIENRLKNRITESI